MNRSREEDTCRKHLGKQRGGVAGDIRGLMVAPF